MDDLEYQEIITRLNQIFMLRNNLLTFSFTAVLAILGLAFTKDVDNIAAIYLLPFFLIIPFTGRIVYYRNEEARIGVLLENSGRRKTLNGYNKAVKESRGRTYNLVAVLVNFEMLFLSIACLMVCILKYPKGLSEFNGLDVLYFSVAVLCTIIVFCIIKWAYNFDNVRNYYEKTWGESKLDADSKRKSYIVKFDTAKYEVTMKKLE